MKLDLPGNYIFEHYSKLVFKWVLETVISTSFNSFYITGLFRGRVADAIRILNSRSCCYIKRKKQSVGHFYSLWATTLSQLNLSVDQTNTKSDFAIHRYFLNPGIPSTQFRFLLLRTIPLGKEQRNSSSCRYKQWKWLQRECISRPVAIRLQMVFPNRKHPHLSKLDSLNPGWIRN